jgi:hypothetical protein
MPEKKRWIFADQASMVHPGAVWAHLRPGANGMSNSSYRYFSTAQPPAFITSAGITGSLGSM